MKKIALLLLCVCFFAASVLTGCTPTPTAEGTGGTEAATGKELTTLKIEAWGIETDPNSVIIKEAVQLYNQRNDNVELTIEFTEQEQYKTKIATLMAANEAPDLFNTWAAGFLKPFVTSGKVYSISEDLDKDPEWKNRFVPGIFAGFTYDGKIYTDCCMPVLQQGNIR